MNNIGFFNPVKTAAVFDQLNIANYAKAIREPINVVFDSGKKTIGFAKNGEITLQPTAGTSYP